MTGNVIDVTSMDQVPVGVVGVRIYDRERIAETLAYYGARGTAWFLPADGRGGYLYFKIGVR